MQLFIEYRLRYDQNTFIFEFDSITHDYESSLINLLVLSSQVIVRKSIKLTLPKVERKFYPQLLSQSPYESLYLSTPEI